MCLVKIYKLRYAIKKKIAGGTRKLTIDMKYFNVYYFCHLANESMGKFEYATNYGILNKNLLLSQKNFRKYLY